ncbi:hypothetical protein [Gracilimonas sp.]|uniref:hypothetical protein n=1 Tax=Gracilimonas sp. TaxID=1974203 RepID=UPI002870D1A4|nr:hypothetical protein [Gracilimonas sp.]
MNTTTYSTSLKPIWKGISYICALFLAVVSLDIVIGSLFQVNFVVFNIKEDVETWIPIFFSLLFIASILSIIYTAQYEISISENTLSKKGLFGSFSFDIDEIDEIFVDVMLVNIKSGRKTISLGNLYSEFGKPVEHIANKIKGNENIRFKGKDKHIKKYFPWAVDE